MVRIRSIAALAVASALTLTAPIFAQDHSTYGASFQDARFGGSVYTGSPKLANTLALVLAGGGTHDFSARSLFAVLLGDGATTEEAKLIRRFGVPVFERYVKTFDFVIVDSLKLLNANGTALPQTPVPNPKNGAALAAALYSDGVDPDVGFNVEYLLDRLVTHEVHVRVMNDIDANNGGRADAQYHRITLQLFEDLKATYEL
jgi:hypothetical protein